MKRRRRANRTKAFGPVVVTVAHDDDAAVGSEIHYDGLAWRVPAWPDRIRDVRVVDDGVIVTFSDRTRRLLEPEDAAA